MAQAYDIDQFANALKHRYPKGLPHLMLEDSPFYTWAHKETTWEGHLWYVALMLGGGVAYSGYDIAAANAVAVPVKRFQVERMRSYVLGYLNAEALLASRRSDAALAKVLDSSMDASMEGFSRRTEFILWNEGGGARGKIKTGSNVATTTITLDDPRHMRWFSIGMKVQLSSDNGITGSAGVRDSGATVKITAIQPQSDGTVDLVADANWNTISGAAVGDFIFLEGDYQNVPYSIYSWCPKTDAAAVTTHAGVDRSIDPTNLSGTRIDVSGASTEEAAIDLLARARFLNIKVDTIWVGSGRMAELQKNIHAKTLFEASSLKVSPEVSIDGISVRGGKGGRAMILEDPGKDDDFMLGTNRKAWTIASLEDWPHLSKGDGLQLRHRQNADEYEYVLAGYGNVVCNNTKDNILAIF